MNVEYNQFDFTHSEQYSLYCSIPFEDPLEPINFNDQESEGEHDGSGNDSDTMEDLYIYDGKSGESSYDDNNSDFNDLLSDRWDNSENETSSEDESDREYTITITGDSESIKRFLDGENDDDFFVDSEYIEFDNSDFAGDGSGEQSSNESESYIREVSTDDIAFYNQNLEYLGVIAGCLFFIVVIILLRYIFKFFNMFF